MNYKSYLIEKNIDLLKNNIVLFYGENFGLKSDLKEIIKQNNKETNITSFNQEDVLKSQEFLFNEIFNFSLFNEKKIIFINQANDKMLEIIKEIEPKITNQKLFLFSEILEKKSKLRNYFEKSNRLDVVPCYADNEIGIKKIILDKLKGFSGLSTQNLNTIIDNCNLNRTKLENELNKVITLFTNKKIEEDKLKKLLNIKVNENFSTLKDEALIGNKAKTNKLLSDTIMESDKNILYLSLINQRLMKLLEIAKITKTTNIENAINNIKPPIFWKDKTTFLTQANKWDLNKIRRVLNQTYSLELEIKSNSSVNHSVLMKKLLVDICDLANAS
jgi:DNA polymerase-3 subunit delta